MPIRTGLLGVSAAVAVGAVAVASGLLPGGGSTYNVSGGSAADRVRSGGAPDLLTQGGGTTAPTDRASASAGASRSSERSAAPSKTASASRSAKPATTPSPSAEKPERTKAPVTRAPATTKAPERAEPPAAKPAKSSAPATTTPPAPKTPTAPKTSSPAPSRTATAPAPAADAQAAILSLVNQERSKVGCRPLSASGSLNTLAQKFSEDMAARGFFGHTDPDGDTPWDRAAQAGVEGLGGENIARGQASAQAVMESWMNSDGHRANILNCDYTTLGVGVHFGSGGPWWTQDFGF